MQFFKKRIIGELLSQQLDKFNLYSTVLLQLDACHTCYSIIHLGMHVSFCFKKVSDILFVLVFYNVYWMKKNMYISCTTLLH